jgi:CRP-like cAMP-binding protein
VQLQREQVLFWPDEPIVHVYFPVDGLVSLLAVIGDGVAVETGLVGPEGIVGLPIFLGADSAPARAVVQLEGAAWRLEATTFREAARREGALHDRLLRYTLSLMTQIALSSGCHRMHSVEMRCIRWLLMCHDRVVGDRLPFTHEVLGRMLGVRRPSVTTAMGRLQRAGLIGYQRGQVDIRDRNGLEGVACPCYWTITRVTERLLGPGATRPKSLDGRGSPGPEADG